MGMRNGRRCQETMPVNSIGRAERAIDDYYSRMENCLAHTTNIRMKKRQRRNRIGARVDTLGEAVWCVWIPGAKFPDPMRNSLCSIFDWWANIIISAIGINRNGILFYLILLFKIVSFVGSF